MNKDNIPAIVKLPEAAKLLRVSVQTLKRWEEAGVITSMRFGTRGDRRYKREQILNILENGTPNPKKKDETANVRTEIYWISHNSVVCIAKYKGYKSRSAATQEGFRDLSFIQQARLVRQATQGAIDALIREVEFQSPTAE